MFAIHFPFPPGELQNKLFGLRTKLLKAVTPHLMPIKGLPLTKKNILLSDRVYQEGLTL